MTVKAVLFDMDGVIRHWDSAGARAGEAAAGLPEGAIERVAYAIPEFMATQVGDVTAREWAAAVGRALVAEHGPGADRAAEIYFSYAGRVDRSMVELVAAVREQVTVALLSNATDQLREHLVHHDLVETFDVVFCSAELRMAKPDVAIFAHAANVLGVEPGECFFTDDRPENVDGARRAGMHAEVFTGRDDLVASLAALGLHVAV
ncbi:MAG TPA: HAD-IA family hydrolase [Mycobacteriales bacterium]|jgi:putative hydrolase of the HAD superfamily|nr:HAD-IA family hydrolase [Mycobacteriales bacterium]